MKTELGDSPRVRAALALLLFVLAFSLRFPYLDYPDKTTLDEGLYVTFTLNTLHQVPFFEIHPPLSRLVFAAIAAPSSPPLQDPKGIGESFGDFPYQNERLFNALLGSLLPVIVFWIGLELDYGIGAALIPALLVVVNRLFIVHSRFMLPDMLLWVFGFFGLALLLASVRLKKSWWRMALLLLAAVSFGFSASVKWTGLGFLLAAVFYLVTREKARYVLQTVLVAFAAYVLVWFSYFAIFDGGNAQINRSYYPRPYVADVVFPARGDVLGYFKSFIQNQVVAWKVNNDKVLMQSVMQSGNPFEWPLGLGIDDSRLGTVNDLPSSALAALAVLSAMGLALYSIRRRGLLLGNEAFLLAGYLLNYLPLLAIMFSRPMFIYHYGTALVFGFLLIPPMFSRIGGFLNDGKPLPRWFVYAIACTIVLSFVFEIPKIYGL